MERAQKVESFPRTLVAAMDLVEKFGTVPFDAKGVHVVSKCADGTLLATQIGESTSERLFSFNLDALKNHVLTMRASGGLQRGKVGVGALMDTWGCARDACPVRHLDEARQVTSGGGQGDE